jgi:hypothetical protein
MNYLKDPSFRLPQTLDGQTFSTQVYKPHYSINNFLFILGVFVFVPSMATYHNLLEFAISHGSFDGGDQGLLNAYFRFRENY